MKYIVIILGFCKLIISKIISNFYTVNNVWLICEKKNEARDNGYYFFKYCIEKERAENVFYIIDKESYDLNKIKTISNNIIFTNSFKHCIYYFKATKLISSQTMPFPFSEKLCKKCFKVKIQKYYWLQHGITKDKLAHKEMDYQYKNYSLVCCASPIETDFFKTEFGYNDYNVKNTGFCRFDTLIDCSKNENIILIMPTFRKWLQVKKRNVSKKEIEDFKASNFYLTYYNLLNDKIFNETLKKGNLKVVFYLHYALQQYTDLFDECNNENIIIASKEDYDVQDLLKKSKVMITDYSSVFFDFSYMKKPVIYYQFDTKQYRSYHYNEGYYSYDRNGFGKVCKNKLELQKELGNIINNKFRIDEIYIKRINDFFVNIDRKNCMRVFEEIRKG